MTRITMPVRHEVISVIEKFPKVTFRQLRACETENNIILKVVLDEIFRMKRHVE